MGNGVSKHEVPSREASFLVLRLLYNREWMVPSFMSREQAAQILATGKSVVFMREACADEPAPADHHVHLHHLLATATDQPGIFIRFIIF